MANELIFDRASKRIVTDLLTRSSGTIPAQFEGDTNVVFDIWSDADWAPEDLKLAIGIPDITPPEDRPSAGYFVIGGTTQSSALGTLEAGDRWQIVSYAAGDDFSNIGGINVTGAIFTSTGTGVPATWTNGSTVRRVSANLDVDATAAEIDAAAEAAQTSTTVTVTGEDGGSWVVVGDDFSDFTLAAASEDNLYPESVVSLVKVQAGDDVSASTIYRISLRRRMLAETASHSAIDAGEASATELVAGVLDTTPAIYEIRITGMPYGGSVVAEVVSAETSETAYATWLFNADESSLQSTLEALSVVGAGNVSVVAIETGPVTWVWHVTFDSSLGDMAITGSLGDAALLYGHGERFQLDFDGSGMAEAMAGRDARDLRMELQDTDTGTVTTLFREPVTVNNDLIV